MTWYHEDMKVAHRFWSVLHLILEMTMKVRGPKAWYPWDVKPPYLTMVFPKKWRKKWGKNMQNTLTSLSNLYFHPDLLRFLLSSIKKVCSDPFKSSSKHRFLHISRWFQPPSFKELFVQCKIESKGRLLPWRRATTGLQEKVEVSVWGKPARGRNFMFGWRRKFRFD